MLDTIAGLNGAPALAAELQFARGGGRTFLARQAVSYPFHITRPHYLDAAQPDLATLYLQSASGGLYRGDRLKLSLHAGKGARAHVTSQAATVVHKAGASGIGVATRLSVAGTAFLALTTDPYILFPGTDLAVQTEVTLAPGAAAILAEGFSTHDPSGRGEPFGRLSSGTRVLDGEGRTLVEERSTITGSAFLGAGSPLGPFRAMGMVLILGAAASSLDLDDAQACLDGLGVLAGASSLPNAAGVGIRILAAGGGQLARALDAAFAIGFEVLLGCPPAKRRK